MEPPLIVNEPFLTSMTLLSSEELFAILPLSKVSEPPLTFIVVLPSAATAAFVAVEVIEPAEPLVLSLIVTEPELILIASAAVEVIAKPFRSSVKETSVPTSTVTIPVRASALRTVIVSPVATLSTACCSVVKYLVVPSLVIE